MPRVAGRFSDSETSWVLAGVAEGSFLCSLITDFLAEGAGWGASPGRGGELGCHPLRRCLKNCEVGVDFSFAALSVFRLRRAQNDPFGTGPNALQNVMALGMHGENCWRRCKNGSSANLVQIDALLVTGAHGSQTGLA